MTALETAEALARMAHADQRELDGTPYVQHLEHVVNLLSDRDEDVRTVAWLHDILEDTVVSADELLAAGMPRHVVDAVELLTRRDHFTQRDFYQAYIETILLSGDELAIVVKMADLVDHLRPNCPERLRKRYQIALKEMTARTTSVI